MSAKEMFEEYNKDLNRQIEKLEEENEILKKNAIHNDKVVDLAKWNENIYKSRINKAIDYINNTDLGTLDKWKLQEILKGEEK